LDMDSDSVRLPIFSGSTVSIEIDHTDHLFVSRLLTKGFR